MPFVLRPSASPMHVRPIVGDPILVVPQGVDLQTAEARPALPRAATRLTLSVRTPTEAACGALRDAVGALGAAPPSWCSDDLPSAEPWEHEGPPLAPTTAESAASESPAPDDRFRSRRAHNADGAPPSARDAAYAALGAYARAMRRDGMPFGTVLATLGTVVDDAAEVEAAGLLPPALLADVQRDAAQCCRAVFAGT